MSTRWQTLTDGSLRRQTERGRQEICPLGTDAYGIRSEWSKRWPIRASIRAAKRAAEKQLREV